MKKLTIRICSSPSAGSGILRFNYASGETEYIDAGVYRNGFPDWSAIKDISDKYMLYQTNEYLYLYNRSTGEVRDTGVYCLSMTIATARLVGESIHCRDDEGNLFIYDIASDETAEDGYIEPDRYSHWTKTGDYEVRKNLITEGDLRLMEVICTKGGERKLFDISAFVLDGYDDEYKFYTYDGKIVAYVPPYSIKNSQSFLLDFETEEATLLENPWELTFGYHSCNDTIVIYDYTKDFAATAEIKIKSESPEEYYTELFDKASVMPMASECLENFAEIKSEAVDYDELSENIEALLRKNAVCCDFYVHCGKFTPADGDDVYSNDEVYICESELFPDFGSLKDFTNSVYTEECTAELMDSYKLYDYGNGEIRKIGTGPVWSVNIMSAENLYVITETGADCCRFVCFWDSYMPMPDEEMPEDYTDYSVTEHTAVRVNGEWRLSEMVNSLGGEYFSLRINKA